MTTVPVSRETNVTRPACGAVTVRRCKPQQAGALGQDGPRRDRLLGLDGQVLGHLCRPDTQLRAQRERNRRRG